MGFRALVLLTLLAGAGLWPSPSLAQTPEETRGRALFAEGQKAMEARDYATACPRFEESYKVSGVAGALLNWADCEEARGRLATALDLWKQGEAKVVRDAERAEFVARRIATLDPRVPRLEVVAPSPPPAELRVEIDGRVVSASSGAIPLDPGKHTLRASAKGMLPEDHTFELAPAEVKRLPLDGKPAAAAPVASASASATATAPPIAPAGAGMSGLSIAGWALGAAGVAGLIGFGVTGGLVLDACGDLNPCKGDRDAVGSLNVANGVLLGVGLAGLAGGATLLLLGSRAPAAGAPGTGAGAPAHDVRRSLPRASLQLDVSPRGGWLRAGVAF